jgi:hypothetical protein
MVVIFLLKLYNERVKEQIINNLIKRELLLFFFAHPIFN